MRIYTDIPSYARVFKKLHPKQKIDFVATHTSPLALSFTWKGLYCHPYYDFDSGLTLISIHFESVPPGRLGSILTRVPTSEVIPQ